MINRYGADTVRLFSMSDTPPHQSLEWKEGGVEGMHRFLKRLWRAVYEHCNQSPIKAPIDAATLTADEKTLRRRTHETIDKVGDDIGRRNTFNTAIAAMMSLFNDVNRFDNNDGQGPAVRHEALESLVLMLSPITPHATQSLWEALGHTTLLINEAWPSVDEAALVRDTIEIVIQVNGKLRSRMEIAANADNTAVEAVALADPKIVSFIESLTVRKVVVVKGKLVNIVAN